MAGCARILSRMLGSSSMSRRLAVLIASVVLPACGSTVQLLPLLPKSAVTTAIQLDGAGNIYVAGYTPPASVQDSQDAFVAKLLPDGTVGYFTALGGSQQDAATALVLGSDGSVYVTGETQSADFPVTAGAVQASNPQPGPMTGFLAKVNSTGTVIYSSYLPSVSLAQMTGIALSKTGEVFLTGLGTPSNVITPNTPQGFILKLDPTLSNVEMRVSGFGGGLIKLDDQGNIYLAGSAEPVLGPAGVRQPVHCQPYRRMPSSQHIVRSFASPSAQDRAVPRALTSAATSMLPSLIRTAMCSGQLM